MNQRTYTLVASNAAGSTQATVAVDVADTPPPPIAGAISPLWDGATGGTGVMFNKGMTMPWENAGGDWIDAAGVAQGPAALATMPLQAVGAHEVDLSAFADRLSGGLLLLGSGAARIGSRRHADPASRPILVCDGAEVACRASAVLVAASTGANLEPDPTFATGSNMALQFDVPAGAKDVKLRITQTRAYSGTTTAKVFLLRVPKMYLPGTPQQGFAAIYARDNGIATDHAVYFATKLDDDWRTALFIGTVTDPAPVVALDPELGVPAFSTHYVVGQTGAMSNDHQWSVKIPGTRPGTTDPTPASQYWPLNHPGTPDDLYFRYYLKLGPGYQCAVQGKKLPGLAWRYGHWLGTDTRGSYSPDAGNGGSPSKGTILHEPNANPPYDYISGGSMRHHALQGPDDANPLKDLIALEYYAYHAEMKDYFGDAWRWGNAQIGYVNIEQGKWYCLEHRVKMNSIDLSAPDAKGNGKGNRDGIVQGWLDGVLVFDKRDVVMRHHPAIKVDEVWLNHYHGGIDPAEAPHPFKMAAIVVAKQYIGPMG